MDSMGRIPPELPKKRGKGNFFLRVMQAARYAAQIKVSLPAFGVVLTCIDSDRLVRE